MSLYTKCILHPALPEDGTRISVMSRHTENNGITLIEVHYHEHLQQLAPPLRLIGSYYKRGLSWEEFELRYLEHIRQSEIRDQVQKLAQRSLLEDITLLCIEETPEHCHRRLLAEECQRYQPTLTIEHR
ncbi:MAG: DUF488 domain-containing protein [Candidatus Woesearchaeota archaeon]